MTVRVHLADDHTMFRQNLGTILASRERMEVVGSTSTDPEAAARVRKTKPDVIVTELDMQPKGPREIIEGLRAASTGSRIVVLTLWDNLRATCRPSCAPSRAKGPPWPSLLARLRSRPWSARCGVGCRASWTAASTEKVRRREDLGRLLRQAARGDGP